MRYHELLEARPWRHYTGQDRVCLIRRLDSDGSLARSNPATVQFGSVTTGRQRVWVGYFVQVIEHDGNEWIAEDPHSVRRALRDVETKLNRVGRSLDVIGLDADWRESGLSANTGWGYHPDIDGAVHMLEPMTGNPTDEAQ